MEAVKKVIKDLWFLDNADWMDDKKLMIGRIPWLRFLLGGTVFRVAVAINDGVLVNVGSIILFRSLSELIFEDANRGGAKYRLRVETEASQVGDITISWLPCWCCWGEDVFMCPFGKRFVSNFVVVNAFVFIIGNAMTMATLCRIFIFFIATIICFWWYCMLRIKHGFEIEWLNANLALISLE